MWTLVAAAFRSIATAAGLLHEPSYIVVRVRPARHEAGRVAGERAA
jgi:hypothetical protein